MIVKTIGFSASTSAGETAIDWGLILTNKSASSDALNTVVTVRAIDKYGRSVATERLSEIS